MAQAFDVNSIDVYLDVEENGGNVTLRLTNEEEGHLSIELEAEDLARAILTASPAFVREIGEVVDRALRSYLSEPGNTP